MTVQDLADKLGFTAHALPDGEREIAGVYIGDLLSWVMGRAGADEAYIPAEYFFEEMPEYQPISQLSDSIAQSMRMMAEIQNLRGQLPGVDCAACGAPTCRAFAEDVVRGNANIDDCLLCRVQPKKEDV